MAANETWARLHADPMFAMKQQEIAAKKAVMKNPVMMASVKLKVSASRTGVCNDVGFERTTGVESYAQSFGTNIISQGSES